MDVSETADLLGHRFSSRMSCVAWHTATTGPSVRRSSGETRGNCVSSFKDTSVDRCLG